MDPFGAFTRPAPECPGKDDRRVDAHQDRGRRVLARRLRFAMLLVLGSAGVWLVASNLIRHSGSFLVIDRPERSDAIVVTQADSLDDGYWTGVRLLAEGYGRQLFVDARTDLNFFGRPQSELAGQYIRATAGRAAPVKVCPVTASSTAAETRQVDACLAGYAVRSVLLVVCDYHTRRSLSTFRRLLPQYHWSVAAVRNQARFDTPWWRRRDWARTALVEWEHLVWWESVDRWRSAAPGARCSIP